MVKIVTFAKPETVTVLKGIKNPKSPNIPPMRQKPEPFAAKMR
jgi:hypothetical protein